VAKILVVDDEFGIGELLRELLSEEGHEVELAMDGSQGLAKVAQEKPDLILLDFMMPVLDGAGMMKRMSANPDISTIPVIIMSSLPEATITGRIDGHVAYVRKPFQIDAILELVATILAQTGRPPERP
jgi:DNA-binding response OmpR family regulator